ncbi:MAG: putative galactose-phosphate uridylyltransferase [Actinomycetia bacterium]|nr:putative galactose-phosphate uridylyltransferase [Actinomycetes bacterium]
MPDLRYDPHSGRWVVVAAERAARPHTFRALEPISADAPPGCPFCPGNEAETPPEVFRTGTGDPDTPGWRVRVFPNKFPIVTPAPAAEGAPPAVESTDRWRRSMPATGRHEVATFSPEHHRSLTELTDAETVELFRVLRDRVVAHRDLGHVYTQVIVNHGKAAGASIEHPHAQIISVDFAPAVLLEELQQQRVEGVVLARDGRDREAAGELAILEHRVPPSGTDGAGDGAAAAVAWAPWASSTPYESIVAPRENGPSFADASDGAVAAVAIAVRDTLRALRDAVGEQPYNVLVHTRPNDRDDDYQWHVHITPRLQTIAGFELGAGVWVNIVPPELAAMRLREAHAGFRDAGDAAVDLEP